MFIFLDFLCASETSMKEELYERKQGPRTIMSNIDISDTRGAGVMIFIELKPKILIPPSSLPGCLVRGAKGGWWGPGCSHAWVKCIYRGSQSDS